MSIIMVIMYDAVYVKSFCAQTCPDLSSQVMSSHFLSCVYLAMAAIPVADYMYPTKRTKHTIFYEILE